MWAPSKRHYRPRRGSAKHPTPRVWRRRRDTSDSYCPARERNASTSDLLRCASEMLRVIGLGRVHLVDVLALEDFGEACALTELAAFLCSRGDHLRWYLLVGRNAKLAMQRARMLHDEFALGHDYALTMRKLNEPAACVSEPAVGLMNATSMCVASATRAPPNASALPEPGPITRTLSVVRSAGVPLGTANDCSTLEAAAVAAGVSDMTSNSCDCESRNTLLICDTERVPGTAG